MHTRTPARGEALTGHQMGELPEQLPGGGEAHRGMLGWTSEDFVAVPESGTCKKEVPGLNERDFSHDGPEPGSDIKW